MTLTRTATIAALFLCIAAASSTTLDPGAKKWHYVGSEACAVCHSAESIGNQYDRWLRTPHAKAVEVLRTKAGLAVAEKHSLKKPWEERRCLGCHATGGGEYPEITPEGVGCESCHGPGSAYGEYANHVDTVNRQGGFDTAVRNGMYQVLGIRNIKRREKVCLRCHNNRRPCYPTTAKEIYRQSISLQVIADMKKGSEQGTGDFVNLRHPLIPPFPQY